MQPLSSGASWDIVGTFVTTANLTSLGSSLHRDDPPRPRRPSSWSALFLRSGISAGCASTETLAIAGTASS